MMNSIFKKNHNKVSGTLEANYVTWKYIKYDLHYNSMKWRTKYQNCVYILKKIQTKTNFINKISNIILYFEKDPKENKF